MAVPVVSSILSLDGFRVQVSFSEDMLVNPDLTDVANYVFISVCGIPLTTTTVTVTGLREVLVTHSGSTLGGRYTLTVSNVRDTAGDAIVPAPFTHFTLGDTSTLSITTPTGDSVEVAFLDSLGNPQGILGATVNDLDITTSYVIPLVVNGVTSGVSSLTLDVGHMTSTTYDVVIGPSLSVAYNGTYLPDVATEFLGIELGTGSSVAGLYLSKAFGDQYGWAFEDTTGRVLPAGTVRLDCTVDVTTAVLTPALYDADIAALSFSDGAVQVNIVLTRVAGVDSLVVSSGIFTQTVAAAWSTGSTTLSLLRNTEADCYSVLVDGYPVLAEPTASFTGVPTINPGATFILAANYEVESLRLTQVLLTSSSTLYTTAWNFLHEVSSSFVGSSLLTNDRILTKRGPLVKSWGDPTPATAQDVTVRVNGISVPVREVNPYTGAIYPETPIPLSVPGTLAIAVDYTWFPAPIMSITGLNTAGLILNKWDLHRGHTAGAWTPSGLGVADTARFPMAVVLPYGETNHPVWIGHRYMGFEKTYSALINSPTTLLLNQSPNRVSDQGITSSCAATKVSFEGETTPQQAETPWSLLGVDMGSLQGDGTYLIEDVSAGDLATGTSATYYREEDLTCTGTINEASRVKVDLDYGVLDGVFTGVGFGFSDYYRLYFMGFLVSKGLRHLGLLQDARNPHLLGSWSVGPSAEITITSLTTFTVSSNLAFITAGGQFQILDGRQAGVYTISECGVDYYQGVMTVTLDATTPFPVSPTKYGAREATAVFDTPWDEELTTYRMISRVSQLDTQRSVQIYLGGFLSGLALDLSGREVSAVPGDTSLLIPVTDGGRVLFGSLSRIATNQSYWDLYRHGYIPDYLLLTIQGLVVAAEMNDLPEEDPNHQWFFTNRFGYSTIDSTGDTLLLKSTSESDSLDFTFGYTRLEPGFTNQVFCDVDATFKVESGVLGAYDACVQVRDSIRQACVATLLYFEGGSNRFLIDMPVVSLSGTMTPVEQGWSTIGTVPNITSQERYFQTSRTTESGFWTTNLTPDIYTSASRIIEARLAVTAYTGTFIGPTWGTNASLRDVRIALLASPAQVALVSSAGVVLAAFAFDWTDGEYHTYRVTIEAGVITFEADDVELGTALLALCDVAPDSTEVRLGFQGIGTSTVKWDSFSVVGTPVAGALRTIGVYLGGDTSDIDNYAVPRTDSLDVPNSDLAATIEEMDWRNFIQVRVHLDQTWGVSVYRPDLPPPPWWTGDFATQITDPSAAWINVEYRYLPKHTDGVGSIAFGALDPRAVTQQRWFEVRYRLYNQPDEDYLAPQGMVLNRFNVIHSGEYNTDTTPEVVIVTSLTATSVSIRSAHQNASRVFVVQVDGSVVPSTTWSFDLDTQILTLDNPLPATKYPVTITFAPAKPITTTYLCSQPFEGSVTKLNEGTPPFPLSQTSEATREVAFGSRINDPTDTLGDPDFILNDPYQYVSFTDPEGSLYESLSFCEVENGGERGLISTICDEGGWIGLELLGPAYHDAFSVPGGPGGTFGSSPVIKGSASLFDPSSILCASGGKKITGGNLGPGTAILHPNYPGPAGYVRTDNQMGLNQEVRLVLNVSYTDTIVEPDDNTPPSAVSGDSNPDGVPGVHGHGACAAQLIDYAATGVSRLGPWGGLSALNINSLLGGGAKTDATTFTLQGGSALTPPGVTDFQIEAAN